MTRKPALMGIRHGLFGVVLVLPVYVAIALGTRLAFGNAKSHPLVVVTSDSRLKSIEQTVKRNATGRLIAGQPLTQRQINMIQYERAAWLMMKEERKADRARLERMERELREIKAALEKR